jgi:cell wall-associated NlpC family hydrolase
VVKIGPGPVDNGGMHPLRRPWPGRALAAAAALAVLLATPVLAAPGDPEPAALATARAEAARLQAEVERLDLRVETLAEDHGAAQARLDGLIQAAHRHQARLERAEQALATTKAAYAGDVRDLYARGPLAPLELLLAAGDIHELSLATGAAVVVLNRDLEALDQVGLATGTLRSRVTELDAARAEVRALVRAEEAREEAARRAMVAAAAARARRLGFTAFADAPAPSRTAAAAVRAALGQVGKPYRWGATGPGSFDCSGLVRFAYADAGLRLPRTSRQQWSAGRHVQLADLRPGDLVFYAHDPANPATIHHVGMYVGQGLMVHAPHTGALVRVDAVRPGGYAGATRPGRARA